MKKLSSLLILIMSAFTGAKAQSILKVSLSDHATPINVSVDGRYFNKRGTSVTVGDLPYGTHYLKIFSLSYTRRGRGYEDVVYEGNVNTENGQVTLFVFDPESGNADVQEQDMDSYLAAHPRPVRPNGGYYNGATPIEGSRDNYGNGNNDNNNTQAPPVPAGTLTDAKKADLKTQVDAKKTDTEKMALLKDALKDEKITTSQVGDMMDWFIFEVAKENFAKWAYSITVDTDNFSELESKFTYKDYQDDLDKFIQSKIPRR